MENKYCHFRTASPLKQRGAATLVISLVILSLITFVTIYTSKSILMEQKITNNDLRARQAFQAAEAGIAAAIDYLSENADRDEDGLVSDEFIYDANNDGTNDTNTSTVGDGIVSVTLSSLNGTTLTRLRISSQGFSADRTATRTIVRDIAAVDPLPNMPDNPFTTRGSVVISGSATVHNPEGHSTIWSGDDIDLGSNNATATQVADVTDAGYPGCMDTPMLCTLIDSSNKVSVGLDVIEHDSNLANLTDTEFFQNFFGMNPTTFRESMVTVDTTGANVGTDADLATNEIIWVEGNATLGGITVGCSSSVTGSNVCPSAKPSILIINGDATFSGSPHFYGIVYVTGTATISSNTTVTGALVISGATNNTSGSLDIWYNSDVLNSTRANGPFAASAGSWRDF